MNLDLDSRMVMLKLGEKPWKSQWSDCRHDANIQRYFMEEINSFRQIADRFSLLIDRLHIGPHELAKFRYENPFVFS